MPTVRLKYSALQTLDSADKMIAMVFYRYSLDDLKLLLIPFICQTCKEIALKSSLKEIVKNNSPNIYDHELYKCVISHCYKILSSMFKIS